MERHKTKFKSFEIMSLNAIAVFGMTLRKCFFFFFSFSGISHTSHPIAIVNLYVLYHVCIQSLRKPLLYCSIFLSFVALFPSHPFNSYHLSHTNYIFLWFFSLSHIHSHTNTHTKECLQNKRKFIPPMHFAFISISMANASQSSVIWMPSGFTKLTVIQPVSLIVVNATAIILNICIWLHDVKGKLELYFFICHSITVVGSALNIKRVCIWYLVLLLLVSHPLISANNVCSLFRSWTPLILDYFLNYDSEK